MAFIRQRGNSHQLIETYREGGTVKQRILANLGPHRTLEDAIQAGVVSEAITSREITFQEDDTTARAKRPRHREPIDDPEVLKVFVQHTHLLLMELAGREVSGAEIRQRLGELANTTRNLNALYRLFLEGVAMTPWVTVKSIGHRFQFIIDTELKEICEGVRPLPKPCGWTAQKTIDFLTALRRGITQKREAAHIGRHRQRWNPDRTIKAEMVGLLDWIEQELAKLPAPEPELSPLTGAACG